MDTLFGITGRTGITGTSCPQKNIICRGTAFLLDAIHHQGHSMVMVVEVMACAKTITWVGEREAVDTCTGLNTCQTKQRWEYGGIALHTLISVAKHGPKLYRVLRGIRL